MAWVESHLNGGGGVKLDTVLENGQVSTTSAYATANFEDISDYDFLFIKVNYDYNGTIQTVYTAADVTQIVVSGNFLEVGIRTPNIGILTLALTKTSISGRSYGGAWRNIYVDIKGTNLEVW